MRRSFISAFIVLNVIGIARVSEAAYPEDSIVKIFLTTTQGKGAAGTGTIIANDGQVLTCYHVIKDAKQIDIILKNKQVYKDVTVVGYSPSYDLAILKVNSLPRITPVKLVRDAEPSTFSLPLDTYAFPAKTGVQDQYLEVHSTSKAWVPSREIRDGEGRALFDFRKPSIDLISFTMVIDNGDSGAPLLSRDGVVGVISGSFQEGGSISWAIPLKYLSQLTPVDKAPKDIQWPDLELMSPRWRTLRSEVSLTLPLTVALDKYADTLDKLRNVCSSEVKKVPELRAILALDVQKTDKIISENGRDYQLIAFVTPSWFELAELQIIQILTGFGQCSDLYSDIRSDGENLKNEVSNYYAGIAHTEINAQLIQTTQESINRIDELTHKLDPLTDKHNWRKYILQPVDSITNYRAAFQNGVDVIDQTDPKSGVAELLDAFTGFDNIIESLLNSQPEEHPKPPAE